MTTNFSQALAEQAEKDNYLKKIDHFDGSDPTEAIHFIDSVEEAANYCNIHPIKIASMKLKGKADKEMQQELKAKNLNWTEYKNIFISRFSDTPYRTDILTRYESLRQKGQESINDYIFRATELIRRINSTGNLSSISVDYHNSFIKGLKDEKFKSKVVGKHLDKCQNLQEVVDLVRRVDEQERKKKRYALPTTDSDIEECAEIEVEEVGYKGNSGYHDRRRARTSNFQQRGGTRNQFNNRSGNKTSDNNMICSFCEKKGHKFINCYAMKRFKALYKLPKDEARKKFFELGQDKITIQEVEEFQQTTVEQSKEDAIDSDDTEFDFNTLYSEQD